MKCEMVRSNLAKPTFYLFLIICLLGVRTLTVEAHGIDLSARIEEDTVYVESTYSGDKPLKAGKIIVLDAKGTELLSGTTDPNGKFSFKLPRKVELTIVLEDGTGHRAEWTIAAGDIEMRAAGKKPDTRESTSVKGILIGLAFTLGLTGMVAYIRKRKR